MNKKAVSTPNRRNLLADIIFIVLFACSLAFLLWKCRFGFGNIDESLYLAIPFRIIQGDALFVKEWHLSQMSSFLILPFLKAYMAAGGGMEGVILTFRYIYTVVHAVAAAFIYLRLRRYSRTGSAAAALFFMIYAPYGIMAMSYNSLGILNLAISLVIMCTAVRTIRLQQIISGLFFAAAVLCSPYLLIVYAAYLIAVICIALCRRKKHQTGDSLSAFTFKSWLFFTVGAAILAAVFAVFILSHASLSEIIAAFQGITADPEHAASGLFSSVKDYILSILSANRFTPYIYIFFAVSFIIMVIDRARLRHRLIYMSIAAFLTFLLLASFMFTNRYLNFVMFPLNAMALFCIVLFSQDDITRKLFTVIWLPGMLYTFCIHMSSNQHFYVISSASCVALTGTAVMIGRCARLMHSDDSDRPGTQKTLPRIIPVMIVICLFLSQAVCETYMRYKSVFWEDMRSVTVCIEEGPSKGLLSSPANADEYNSFLKAVSGIDEEYPQAASILLLSEKTWGYLVLSDLKNASYSPWLSIAGHADETVTRLLSYYELNPDKIPDLIYLEPEYADKEITFETIAKFRPTSLENGATLLIREAGSK